MSKSEKSAYFRHVFADNYFCVHLKKTFSAWNSAFFDTHIEFLNKKIFYSSLHFLSTLIANAQETAKKRKIFYDCIIEFN